MILLDFNTHEYSWLKKIFQFLAFKSDFIETTYQMAICNLLSRLQVSPGFFNVHASTILIYYSY